MALSDEDRMMAEAAARIAEDHLAPNADALDRQAPGSRETLLANLKRLADNGFMALNVPAEYGGTEAGTTAFSLVIDQLARRCASTAVTVSVTNMVGEVIASVGTEEQKQTHLPRLADGTYPAGAFCLTESGAGSDPAGMKTRARMDGNEWVISGSKIYITSGEYAGLFVVWAVTNPDAPKGKGISCFLVEAGTPGMTQWMVADTETELEAARLLIAHAAELKDAGAPFARAASMAKLYASEAANRACYTALQLHGGAGYTKDYPVERYARDARITTIYEGTSEVQRMIIARVVLAA